MESIKDHVKKDLSILFVGFNPSIRSGETGHHYANPNNRFWKILFEAGLTPRIFKPEEDASLLEFGYGLTNIVKRPTKAADEIKKDEYIEGKSILKKKVEYYQPFITCFVGKGVYQEYSGKKKIPWGRQENSVLPVTIDFVAPSSSGLVRMKWKEIVEVYKELALMLDKQKEESQ